MASVFFDGCVCFGKLIFPDRVQHHYIPGGLCLLTVGIVFQELTHRGEGCVSIDSKMMKHAQVVKIVPFERCTRLKNRGVFHGELCLLQPRIVSEFLFIEFLVLAPEITVRIFVKCLRCAVVWFQIRFAAGRQTLSKAR